MKLRVLSYNLHKGFDTLGRKFVLTQIRRAIRKTGADLVFLQEVVGEHATRPFEVDAYPLESQFEFLADTVWEHYRYGKNAATDVGHHGNALLSQFPIRRATNIDISTNRFERRGILHCTIPIPRSQTVLHALCVHLNLFERGRRKQLAALCERIARAVPKQAPLIVAGDFNDWRESAHDILAKHCGLVEAHVAVHGESARSFPSLRPVMRLDRVYVRGVRVDDAKVLKGAPWNKLSDHLALVVDLDVASRG